MLVIAESIANWISARPESWPLAWMTLSLIVEISSAIFEAAAVATPSVPLPTFRVSWTCLNAETSLRMPSAMVKVAALSLADETFKPVLMRVWTLSRSRRVLFRLSSADWAPALVRMENCGISLSF